MFWLQVSIDLLENSEEAEGNEKKTMHRTSKDNLDEVFLLFVFYHRFDIRRRMKMISVVFQLHNRDWVVPLSVDLREKNVDVHIDQDVRIEKEKTKTKTKTKTKKKKEKKIYLVVILNEVGGGEDWCCRLEIPFLFPSVFFFSFVVVVFCIIIVSENEQ